jgi:hypothetical protein
MLFMLWLIVRTLTRLLAFPNGDDGTKDLEILVLRHQLRVLRPRPAGSASGWPPRPGDSICRCLMNHTICMPW